MLTLQSFATHYRDIAGVASSQHGLSFALKIRQHVDHIRSTPLSPDDVPVISRRAVED